MSPSSISRSPMRPKDTTAHIVLLQDAVYSAARVQAPAPVYVVADDVARRGLSAEDASLSAHDQL